MKRSQLGFCVVVTVIKVPPAKNMVPVIMIRQAIVSLCLDSSAFSCRYSLSDICCTGVCSVWCVFKVYRGIRIVDGLCLVFCVFFFRWRFWCGCHVFFGWGSCGHFYAWGLFSGVEQIWRRIWCVHRC